MITGFSCDYSTIPIICLYIHNEPAENESLIKTILSI